MDDSELLRRAANKVRGTAQDAIEKNQGWMVEEKPGGSQYAGPAYTEPDRWAVVRDLYPHHEIAMDLTKAHADHIALWHPGVALAVAGWLEHEAGMAHDAENRATLLGHRREYPHEVLEAVTVARALLGET